MSADARVSELARMHSFLVLARARGGGACLCQPDGLDPMGLAALDMVRIEFRAEPLRVLRPDRPVRGWHQRHRAAEGQRLYWPRGPEQSSRNSRSTLACLGIDNVAAGHGECIHSQMTPPKGVLWGRQAAVLVEPALEGGSDTVDFRFDENPVIDARRIAVLTIALLLLSERLLLPAETFDAKLNHVAVLQELRWRHAETDTGRGSGRDDVARHQAHELREI